MTNAWETETEEVDNVPETLQERMARLRASIANPEKQVKSPHPGVPNSGSWQPGKSGNPDGRPIKPLCITSIAKEYLDKPAELPPDAPDFMKGWTWAELIAYNWVVKTNKIDAPIFKEFLDRTEGKVVTPIEATGKDGMPLEVSIDARGKLANAINRLAARAGKN